MVCFALSKLKVILLVDPIVLFILGCCLGHPVFLLGHPVFLLGHPPTRKKGRKCHSPFPIKDK